MTIGNALIEDQSIVVTWAEIMDVGDKIGNKEGLVCSVIYNKAESSGSEVEILTFEGTAVDFDYSARGEPEDWYFNSSWDA